jgi:hypothetical protein
LEKIVGDSHRRPRRLREELFVTPMAATWLSPKILVAEGADAGSQEELDQATHNALHCNDSAWLRTLVKLCNRAAVCGCDGRRRSWDLQNREPKHCAARPRRLPLRDTRAPLTAIGAGHHAAHRIIRSSHARHAHEGGTLRRDRQIPRGFFFFWTLWALGGVGAFTLILSARPVGSATEPAPVFHGDRRWRRSHVGCCKNNDKSA